MAATQRYLTPLSRGMLSSSFRPQVTAPSFICPLQQQRYASKTSKSKDTKPKKKKPMYTQYDIRDAIQFSLCDAMRSVPRNCIDYPPCEQATPLSRLKISSTDSNDFFKPDIFAPSKPAEIPPPSNTKSTLNCAQNETAL